MRWFALAAIAAALCGAVLSPAAGEVPRGAAKPVAVRLTAALGLELDGHTFQQGLGAAVGAGDFNGDGLADVLIRDEPFRTDSWEGRIVLGRRRGLGRRETTAGRRPVAIRGRIRGDFPNFNAAGDVNGDGRGDVVVAEGGRAWVVFGRASRRPIDLQRLGPGGFVIHSTRALGVVDAIGPVGDLDGDGLGDLAASVPAANPRSDGHPGGRVAVLFGKRDGRGLVAGDAHMSAVIDPPEEALSFGARVVGLGDADGDRVPDLAVAAPATGARPEDWMSGSQRTQLEPPTAPGAVYIVSGRLARRGRTVTLSESSGGWLGIVGPPGAQRLGAGLAAAGDQDGDGLADVLIGQLPGRIAFSNNAAPTGAWVVAGRRDTAADVAAGPVSLAQPGTSLLTLLDPVAGDRAGAWVSAVGDLDGDRRQELLIGAPLADPGGERGAGSAFLVHGGARTATLDITRLAGRDGRRYDGRAQMGNAGGLVEGVGDFNGDARPDFVIGAPNADVHGDSSGTVFLVLGPSPAAFRAGGDDVREH